MDGEGGVGGREGRSQRAPTGLGREVEGRATGWDVEWGWGRFLHVGRPGGQGWGARPESSAS